MRHIQTSLEDKYIKYLIEKDTELIKHDNPTVLDYLFINYGKVPSEEVKHKEAEVLNISFNSADPMVLIYCSIEQLQTLVTDANIPYFDAHHLEFGLNLIRSTHDFEKGLSNWNGKPEPHKTWPNFKKHFNDAQTELKDIHGPTMQQAGFHHTNMLAEQLRITIETQRTEMLAILQEIVIADNNSPIEGMPPPTAPPAPVENTVVHTDVQLGMLRTLQEMQQSNVGQSGRFRRGGSGGRGRDNCEKNRLTPDNVTFPRRITDNYCHIHGGCNHVSSNCTRKVKGHNDEAMMQNCFGGLNAFFQILAQA